VEDYPAVSEDHEAEEPKQAEDPKEPHPLRSLFRVLMHAIHIGFYLVLHWGLLALAHWAGHEHDPYVNRAIQGSGVMFVVSFFVFGGTELIADCWEAIRTMVRRIRS
jgi:hypothetical protein